MLNFKMWSRISSLLYTLSELSTEVQGKATDHSSHIYSVTSE